MEKKDEIRLIPRDLGWSGLSAVLSGSGVHFFVKKIRYVARLTNRPIWTLKDAIVNPLFLFHTHPFSYPFEIVNPASKLAFQAGAQEAKLTKKRRMFLGFIRSYACGQFENVEFILANHVPQDCLHWVSPPHRSLTNTVKGLVRLANREVHNKFSLVQFLGNENFNRGT